MTTQPPPSQPSVEMPFDKAKQAALDALARHTGVTDPEKPWWNLNMPKALDIMLPAALAVATEGDWREQLSTREAIRSELIRQHIAGECGGASAAPLSDDNAHTDGAT